MPLNLLKKYPCLLDLSCLNEEERKLSLRRVFDRDITDNDCFLFRGKKIYPIKTNGIVDMDREFFHLTTYSVLGSDNVEHRVYDHFRSERLHWIKVHIDEKTGEDQIVFSVTERNQKKRVDQNRVYIYNKNQKYVVVLEPYRNNTAYFLLTAYYLNEKYSEKQMKKKLNKGVVL
jgi:hypothetical protein